MTPQPAPPTSSPPVIPIFARYPCGVQRWYIADSRLRAAIVALFGYPTLTEAKRAALTSLGVSFRIVPDPDGKPSHKVGKSGGENAPPVTSDDISAKTLETAQH